MSRKTKTKPFVSKDDIKAIKKACKILAACNCKLSKLQDTRTWCDENKDQDPGGAKWQKATTKLYCLLDELYAANVVDLSSIAEEVLFKMYHD